MSVAFCSIENINFKVKNMKIPKDTNFVDYNDLNPIQQKYIDDCIFLENMGLPNDLFDDLYRAIYKIENKK
jgi:hypothetical protein